MKLYTLDMWLIYVLLSSITAAAVAILAKLGLKNVDSTLATTVRAMIMAAFFIITSFMLNKFNGFALSTFSSKDWILIILSGLAGALSWLFYFFALKEGSATGVVAIDHLSVVFVVILAAIFLGEGFSLKSILGAFLMTGGAILISLK